MFGFTVEDVLNWQFEIFECTIEVWVDGRIHSNTVQAPRIVIQQNFLELVQQAVNDNKPVRIKLSRMVECFNEWTGETKMREASIAFMNRPYVDKVGV